MKISPRKKWSILKLTAKITFASFIAFALAGMVLTAWRIEQTNQTAVYSAVEAAVASANSDGGVCGPTVVCRKEVVCTANPVNPPRNNFDVACIYAKANGFVTTDRQQLVLSATTGLDGHGSTLTTRYSVTAKILRRLPLGIANAIAGTPVQASAFVLAKGNSTCVGFASDGQCGLDVPPAAPGSRALIAAIVGAR